MSFTELAISGVFLVEPPVYRDERGYFCESFNRQVWNSMGIEADFVQDNQAYSTYGVLRGLHYQVPPFEQAKLVRVVRGEVLDLIVDIREGSPTYGQSLRVHLSEKNHHQLFVPRGFAHGYIALSKEVLFLYKCDNTYSKAHEGGILYNDPTLQLDWELPKKDLIVSEKDRKQPVFGAHRRFIPPTV